MAKRRNMYIVMKVRDLQDYITKDGQNHLDGILEEIQRCREEDGKKPVNKYVVINQDEPYAEAVWDIVIAFENLKEQLPPNASPSEPIAKGSDSESGGVDEQNREGGVGDCSDECEALQYLLRLQHFTEEHGVEAIPNEFMGISLDKIIARCQNRRVTYEGGNP